MARFAVRLHMRHEGADAVDRAIEIDADDPFPVGERDFLDAARRATRRRCCKGCAPCRTARSSRPPHRRSLRRPTRRTGRWRPGRRSSTGCGRRPAGRRSSTSAIITFMPRSRNVRASPSPMPLAAPVTNAVLPLNSFIFFQIAAMKNCKNEFSSSKHYSQFRRSVRAMHKEQPMPLAKTREKPAPRQDRLRLGGSARHRRRTDLGRAHGARHRARLLPGQVVSRRHRGLSRGKIRPRGDFAKWARSDCLARRSRRNTAAPGLAMSPTA